MNRLKISASSLFRAALCHRSPQMEYGLPEEDSPQSKEGTLLHDYAEHPEYDRSVLSSHQQDLLRRNDELVEHIRLRLGVFNHEQDIHAYLLPGEKRLDNGLISGTPDFVAHNPLARACWINDVKFGYKIVERAELNLQLRAYCLLVYDFVDPKPERIFVSITQPRLRPEERITLAEYHPEEIEASRKEIASILERAGQDRAKLIPGEVQCRYCKAKLFCPAYQETLTVPMLWTVGMPSQELSKTAREAHLEKRLAEVSDEELEKVLVAISFAGQIDSAAKDEARKRIEAGKLTNYELTKAYEKREITDAKRALSILALARIAERDRLFEACSISLRGVEELYRRRIGCTAKDARDRISAVLRDIIEVTQQKPRVIRKNA